MKARIVVGDVELRLDGLDLDVDQVRSLLRTAARIAHKPEPDDEPKAPIGFAAIVDRLPQDVDRAEYYEEEE